MPFSAQSVTGAAPARVIQVAPPPESVVRPPSGIGVSIALGVTVLAFLVTRHPRFHSRSDQIPGALLGLFIGLVTVASLDYPSNVVCGWVVLSLFVWWVWVATRRHAERDKRDIDVDAKLGVLYHVRDVARARRLLDIEKEGWRVYHALDALTLECREARSAIACAPTPDPYNSVALQKRIDEEQVVNAVKRRVAKQFLREHADEVYLLVKDMKTHSFDTSQMDGRISPNMTFEDVEHIRLYLGSLLHAVGGQ